MLERLDAFETFGLLLGLVYIAAGVVLIFNHNKPENRNFLIVFQIILLAVTVIFAFFTIPLATYDNIQGAGLLWLMVIGFPLFEIVTLVQIVKIDKYGGSNAPYISRRLPAAWRTCSSCKKTYDSDNKSCPYCAHRESTPAPTNNTGGFWICKKCNRKNLDKNKHCPDCATGRYG